MAISPLDTVADTPLAVLAEAAIGLMLFSALVSKILNGQQEKVLNEVHRLAFENRLGRVRTNLHFSRRGSGDLPTGLDFGGVKRRLV